MQNVQAITSKPSIYALEDNQFVECYEASFKAVVPFARIVKITPFIAIFLMAQNAQNRPLAKDKLAQYIQDMKDGRFDGLNGQTIVISKDGLLNDGQNRLTAVIESGVTLETFVVFGADRNGRMTLDQGKPRTSANYLAMSGVENAKVLSAVGSIVIAYQRGDLVFGGSSRSSGNVSRGKKGRATKVEITDFVQANMAELEEAVDLTSAPEAKPVLNHHKLAAAAFILMQEVGNTYVVRNFISKLAVGHDLGGKDPILVARNRLISEKASGSFPVGKVLELVFKAWNAHIKEESFSHFRLSGELPEIVK